MELQNGLPEPLALVQRLTRHWRSRFSLELGSDLVKERNQRGFINGGHSRSGEILTRFNTVQLLTGV
jgi:hypothetical protein